MKNLLIYILFFLCLSIGYSQNTTPQPKSIEEELSFYLLDVENGLSNNVINSIEQDSLGFIWVATPDGLNRYDGTQFKTYKKNDLIENSNISNNYIQQIKLIDEGKLFLATTKGVNIYNPKQERFEVLNQNNGLLNNDITCLAYGSNGELILGINYKGIQILGKERKIKSYSYDPENISSLSSNEIVSLIEQGDSILWVGTANKGLNKINYKTKRITRIPFGKNRRLPSLRINALYIGNDGNLWIGSKDGLQVITTKGDTLSLNIEQGLSDSNVLCFEEDNAGKIWIGTRNGGLNIINKSDFLSQKSDLLVKWYLPRDDGSSVFNRTVSSLKMDWEGNMWIGTSTGLNFVNPRGEPIKLLHKNIAHSQTLGHDRIGALAESYESKIWIGTDGAGLDLFDPKTGKFKHYRHNPKTAYSLSNNYIISIYEDTKNRLWVGTYQGGLNKMYPNTGRFKHYLQGKIEKGSDVRIIFEDSKGEIWVGTNRGGLYKYKEKKDQFEFIHSLGKIDIRDISEDRNGYLWMATYGDGILRYNPKNDKTITYNSTNTKGIESDIVYCILTLPGGDILAGTSHEGLIRLNPQKNTVLNFTENDGLSNNTVSSMVKENDSSIWLGTFKGISNYNEQTNELYNLNTFNNIQQSEFNIGSALKSKSGIIYFGGNKGLNIFNPNNLHSKKKTYPIVFEKLEVFNKKTNDVEVNKKGILEQSILYEDHIILDHNQNFFSIDYVMLKYPFIKNTIYSYRLEGYHDHWINTNSAGKVNLTNIPHGSYTLNVKAKFGTGNEVFKQLFITINPPFWKTPLAYICYLLLIITSIWGIMKYYAERIKLINSLIFEKKQRHLEQKFNEERIRFFTSFSHELKTPLTLIIAPLEDLIAEVKTIKYKDSLKLIYKNSKLLLQSINQLLEFRKSNLGLSELIINKHNLSNHLEQWVLNYYPLAKKRQISLTHSYPEENFTAWFDLEKLHIIVNNLLSNAFKYTQEKGKIHVSLTYDDTYFTIKVKDTGFGISPRELERVFERYYQSNSIKNKNGVGIGLALSKDLTELHKGLINVDSQLHKGSVFTVSIPRDKSLFTNSIYEVDTIIDLDKEKASPLDTWTPSLKTASSEKKVSNIHFNENREVVLLIDDNPDILSYLDRLLEDKYDLIYANDGEEGVLKAIQYIPDLIISDIMMPKINGIELCTILKTKMETTHIPIILLSAKGNIESIKDGYEKGADDYIVKPFSSELLQTRIKNLLDSRIQLRKYFLKEEKNSPELSKEKSKLLEQEKMFLNKLELVILEHLNEEKMDVWVISQSIGMSRTSLFRKLKAISGLNINQFVSRVKMNKAAELIKAGDSTISQASYEVGFSNVKYFRKLFKEQFGKLPSELIRKNKP